LFVNMPEDDQLIDEDLLYWKRELLLYRR
jgi:hypothetical protein